MKRLADAGRLDRPVSRNPIGDAVNRWFVPLLLVIALVALPNTVHAQADAPAPIIDCANGFIEHLRGRPLAAEPWLASGFAARADVPDTYRDQLAICGMALGASRYTTGRWEDAEVAYTETLAWVENGGDPKWRAVGLNNLGILLGDQGRFGEAADRYREALAIVAQIPEPLPPDVRFLNAGLLNSLAIVYGSQRRFAEARELLEQALVVMRTVPDTPPTPVEELEAGLDPSGLTPEQVATFWDQTGSFGEATILIGLAQLAYANDQETIDVRVNAAADLFREAIERARITEQYDVAYAAYANLAAVYRDAGQPADAERALAEAETLPADNRPPALEGIAAIAQADLAQDRGDLTTAEAELRNALAIFERSGIGLGIVRARASLGLLAEDQGRLDVAEEELRAAAERLEQIRAVSGDDLSRIQVFAGLVGLFDGLVRIGLTRQDPEAAFMAAERGRARAFLDALATDSVQLGDEVATQLFTEAGTRYAARERARAALVTEELRPDAIPGQVDQLRRSLAIAEAEYDTAVAEITAYDERLADLVPGRRSLPDSEAIRAALPENATLVSYWVLIDELVIFVLNADGISSVRVPVDNARLERLVEAIRRAPPNPQSAAPEAELSELYQLLIEPVTDHLSTERLFIVPHSVLHYVPFAALGSAESPLIERYAIGLLPNAGALTLLRRAPTQPGPPLIIAQPEAPPDTQLRTLTFAEREAVEVAALYNVQPLINAGATEAALRAAAPTAGLIHLAAHGAFELNEPLQSRIWLAAGADDDGRLTVADVYSLKLGAADLVILSACETLLNTQSSRTAVQYGDEVIGLTRAFFYAGAPTVISTLWTVRDAASYELMREFHEQLREGTGKAEALRRAQLELHNEGYHPFYWSGYMLSGDLGPASQRNIPPQDESNDSSGNADRSALLTLPGGWLAWSGGAVLGFLALVWLFRRPARKPRPPERPTRRTGRTAPPREHESPPRRSRPQRERSPLRSNRPRR